MLGDPGADSEGKWKSKQAAKMAQRKVILRVIFFLARLDFPLPPLSVPGSLRMISVQPIDLLCIYVSEITAYVTSIWGCTEILLPLVHISGCPTEAKKIILNAVSITACLVHKVLKFLVCVTHDIITWLRIFTAANALSLSVQGYTVTNTHLIRVRNCKWRNCFKIY